MKVCESAQDESESLKLGPPQYLLLGTGHTMCMCVCVCVCVCVVCVCHCVCV